MRWCSDVAADVAAGLRCSGPRQRVLAIAHAAGWPCIWFMGSSSCLKPYGVPDSLQHNMHHCCAETYFYTPAIYGGSDTPPANDTKDWKPAFVMPGRIHPG